MPIQLAAPTHQDLSVILSEASQRLSAAHVAYAEQCFSPHHAEDTLDVRNVMISLLATFEDGCGYGALESE